MATKLFTVECENGDTTYYMDKESNGVITVYTESKVVEVKKTPTKRTTKTKTPKSVEKPKTVKKVTKEKVVKVTKTKTTKKSKTDIDDLLE